MAGRGEGRGGALLPAVLAAGTGTVRRGQSVGAFRLAEAVPLRRVRADGSGMTTLGVLLVGGGMGVIAALFSWAINGFFDLPLLILFAVPSGWAICAVCFWEGSQ